MDNKQYAVFVDFPPDTGLEIFDTYDEAKKDYEEQMKRLVGSGLEVYICEVIKKSGKIL